MSFFMLVDLNTKIFTVGSEPIDHSSTNALVRGHTKFLTGRFIHVYTEKNYNSPATSCSKSQVLLFHKILVKIYGPAK